MEIKLSIKPERMNAEGPGGDFGKPAIMGDAGWFQVGR